MHGYRASFLFKSLIIDSAFMGIIPLIESRSTFLDNYIEFVSELRRMFDDPEMSKNAASKLKNIRQVNLGSFYEYQIQFRLLVQEVDWTESSKI